MLDADSNMNPRGISTQIYKPRPEDLQLSGRDASAGEEECDLGERVYYAEKSPTLGRSVFVRDEPLRRGSNFPQLLPSEQWMDHFCLMELDISL